MKTIELSVFLIFNSMVLLGQIKNGGFEIPNDSLNKTPRDWGISKVEGFNFYLDNNVKYQGEKSFVIKSLPSVDTQQYLPFSQIVNMEVPILKRVKVSAFIKTDSTDGRAAIWCQVWDINRRQIGFFNSVTNSEITGSKDWEKHTLNLTLNQDCKFLLLGGYLQGRGTIWFDNFVIEDTLFSSDPPSRKVKRYTKNLYRVVKLNSIYSDSLDWELIDRELDYLTRGLTNIEEVSFISSYTINKLREVGDNHSFMMSKELSEKASEENIDGRQPSGEVIENSIGYINVPGFVSESDTSISNFAAKIQKLIQEIDNANDIQGWIVDLRENSGGNMYPMIAGLGPILGDGTLGYFSATKKKNTKWFYKDGKCGAGNERVVKVNEPYLIKNQSSKIAVLIGPSTASSGEMTAISFVGRSNTKIFGQESAGYITANSTYKLPDNSTLALAVSHSTDRNLKKYVNPIVPDVLIEEDNKCLMAAINWIKGR